MRHTPPASANASMSIFSKKADLNGAIKRCGIRALVAKSSEERIAEIARMDDLFLKALADGLVDSYAHCAMIHALGQAGEIDRALTMYREIQNKNCFIHAAILQALRKNNRFPILSNIYCELIRLSAETDSHIFSIVISAAKENNQLDFAKRVYRDAYDRNQINEFVVRAYGYTDKFLQLQTATAASSVGSVDLQKPSPGVNRMSALARAFLFPFAEEKLPTYSEAVGASTLRK